MLLLRLLVQRLAKLMPSPRVLLLPRCFCLAAPASLRPGVSTITDLLQELSAAFVPSQPELTVTPSFPRFLVLWLLARARVCVCANRSPGKPRISGTAILDFTLELVAVPGKDDEILEMNGLID